MDKVDTLDVCTVPEARETFSLQRDQLVAGLRFAMLFPCLPDGSARAHDIALPPRFFAHYFTPAGLFYYHTAFVTREELDRAVEGGYLNCFLNLGPYNKRDVATRVAEGEHGIAVVEAAPDGTEVRCAWGTLQTAEEQLAYFQETKTPGHECFVTSPLHVIAARLAVAASEVTNERHG
jgi:hypothetical protein